MISVITGFFADRKSPVFLAAADAFSRRFAVIFMKLWLSKNSEISLREQLTRQIMLAIVSGDLKTGDKLPSVRELALRHKIHANTASAAYRRLEETGWVESRVGSGVYVRAVAPTKIAETEAAIENELDEAILSFLGAARRRGFDDRQIKARLDFWLRRKAPKKIVIVESDADLSRILVGEISAQFSAPVAAAEPSKIGRDDFAKNSLVVSLSDSIENLPPAAAFFKLKLNSVQDSMRGQVRPEATDLVGVASHWEKFRRWSLTMLVAVGLGEENLVVRDASRPDWQKGLHSCRFVIADSLTAARLPENIDARVFRLISPESIAELRARLK